MKGINVLSLFDGMCCGRIALERAGIRVNKYFASEIDKHAISVTQRNYPDTIQLGDVRNITASQLPEIDLLCGGSPCQGFSFAGKGLNFADERSKLFFEFVRLKEKLKPRFFFLENVKMKREHELVISKYMGVNPIEIDSALVSAQSRVRLYWTNINARAYGMFGDMAADIPQPEDKRILLKHILDDNPESKYYLTEAALNRLLERQPKINPDKAYAVTAKNNTKSGSHRRTHSLIQEGIVNDNGSIRKTGDKSLSIDANYFKGMDNHGQRTIIQCKHGFNEGGEFTEKSPALTTSSWQHNNHIKQVIQLNPNKESGGVQPYQQNRIYDPDGLSPALVAQMSSGTHAVMDGVKIRRLTPVECERLQCVPDGFTALVSDTQRYRMLGNGWNVDTIVHFFNYLPKEWK